jgi:hypothetical protein
VADRPWLAATLDDVDRAQYRGIDVVECRCIVEAVSV